MKLPPLRTALLSTLLASFLLVASLHGAYAQSPSIAGDELCGSSAETVCSPSHLKEMGKRLMLIFASVGGALLVVLIMIRVMISVWLTFTGKDPSALSKARGDAFNAVVGFVIVIGVFGGLFLAALSLLGAQPWVSQLLRAFSYGFVEHAYAQEQLLPNTLASTSLYDIIIAGANLAMKFFVYPGLIAAWVASGFKFIYSQGNPEGLKTARSWSYIAVIVTIIAFTLQGFILAFQGTAKKVFNGAGTSVIERVDERGKTS